MRCLWGLGPGNAICSALYLSKGDRPGLSEIVLPCVPRILAQPSLASTSSSITACKAILQRISFVSLHFQKKDRRNDCSNTWKWCEKANEIVGGETVSAGCYFFFYSPRCWAELCRDTTGFSLMKSFIISFFLEVVAKLQLPVKCWISQTTNLISWHVNKLCKYLGRAMP